MRLQRTSNLVLIFLLFVNAVTAQNAHIIPSLNQQIIDLDTNQTSVSLSFLTAVNNVSNIYRGRAQSKYLLDGTSQVSIKFCICEF